MQASRLSYPTAFAAQALPPMPAEHTNRLQALNAGALSQVDAITMSPPARSTQVGATQGMSSQGLPMQASRCPALRWGVGSAASFALGWVLRPVVAPGSTAPPVAALGRVDAVATPGHVNPGHGGSSAAKPGAWKPRVGRIQQCPAGVGRARSERRRPTVQARATPHVRAAAAAANGVFASAGQADGSVRVETSANRPARRPATCKPRHGFAVARPDRCNLDAGCLGVCAGHRRKKKRWHSAWRLARCWRCRADLVGFIGN